MVLTLFAEVLSGETVITPGGAVDMATATGLEAFTWDGWLDQLRSRGEDPSAVAVDEGAVEGAEALSG